MENTMTSALSSAEELLPGTEETLGWLGEVFERIY